MHCQGCKSLIELTLGDEFADVAASVSSKQVNFSSPKSLPEVKARLERIFARELASTPYRFSNLVVIN